MSPTDMTSNSNQSMLPEDFNETFNSFINSELLFEMAQQNANQQSQIQQIDLAPSEVANPFGFSINQQNDYFVDYNSIAVDPSVLNMESQPRSESPIDVCSLSESTAMECDDNISTPTSTIPTPFLKNLPLNNPTLAKLKSEERNGTFGINSFNNTKIRHTNAQAPKLKDHSIPVETQPKPSKPYKVRNTSVNKIKAEEKGSDMENHADMALTPEEIEMLANLNPKERRQIRNKISARNFRVRRKEYISTLENKVEQQEGEIDELKEYIHSVESENQSLKEEVDDLRAKFNQLSLNYQSLSNTAFISHHGNMESFSSSLSELTSAPTSRGSSPILTDKDRLGQNCGRESRLSAYRTSTFDKSKHDTDSNLPFLQRSMDVCFPV